MVDLRYLIEVDIIRLADSPKGLAFFDAMIYSRQVRRYRNGGKIRKVSRESGARFNWCRQGFTGAAS
jgi:hypothetical protein